MSRLVTLPLKLLVPLCAALCSPAISAEFSPRVTISELGSELGRTGSWMFTSSFKDVNEVRTHQLIAYFDLGASSLEPISLILRCNSNQQIDISIHNLNELSLYATENYEFTDSTNEEPITGSFSKVGEHRLTIESNALELAKRLYQSSTVQMTLTENSKTDITGVLDTKGFKDAFDYVCVTSENYSKVSGLPRKDSINSPCDDPDRWAHCKKPKVYETSKRSETELLAQAEYMIDNYITDEGKIKQTFLRPIVLNTSDEYINGPIRQQLLTSLRIRNTAEAVALMKKYNLHLPVLDEKAGLMGMYYGELPNALLRMALQVESYVLKSAIERNNIASVNRIVKGGNYSFDRIVRHGDLPLGNLLNQAIENGHTELVQLLLDAGANPNTKPDFDRTVSLLSTAIRNNNTDTVNALIQAGARVITKNNVHDGTTAHALQAVLHGNVDILETILNYSKVDHPKSLYEWDLLMEAIWARKKPMIDFLIPMSDPFYNSTVEMENTTVLSGETLSYFPKASAYFLALHQNDAYKDELLAALEARATTLHGADAIKIIRNRAALSELDFSRGKPITKVLPDRKFIDELSQIIENSDVFELTAESNSHDITTAMDALLDKHQALIINEENLTQEDRDQVQHITDFGGWNQPLHDMLDILFTALDDSISQTVLDKNVNQWKQNNRGFGAAEFQELKLSHWVGELPDSPSNSRLQKTWQAIITK